MFIMYLSLYFFFFFKQKTAYEMRISDWSSDVCSSDLLVAVADVAQADGAGHVLQFAVAIGGTGQAVERMVGDVEFHDAATQLLQPREIGRASCRERVCQYV